MRFDEITKKLDDLTVEVFNIYKKQPNSKKIERLNKEIDMYVKMQEDLKNQAKEKHKNKSREELKREYVVETEKSKMFKSFKKPATIISCVSAVLTVLVSTIIGPELAMFCFGVYISGLASIVFISEMEDRTGKKADLCKLEAMRRNSEEATKRYQQEKEINKENVNLSVCKTQNLEEEKTTNLNL